MYDEKPLRDLSVAIKMGPFGSSIKKDRFVSEGVPVINGRHLHGIRLADGQGYEYISEEHADELRNANARSGDVVVTHRGTLGQASLIPQGARYERYVISQSQLLVRSNTSLLDPQFLAYFLKSPTGQLRILDFATQTGVPALAQPSRSIAKVLIPVPPLPEQQAIAEVLGALDDKIAANTALATTVDRYLETLLDEMASGADVATLGSIADVNRRSVKPVTDGNLRYVDIASVAVGAFEYPDVSAWSDAPGRARRGLSAGDTMWSTVRPNRRSHALNLEDDALLVASTGLAVLSPREVGFAYLYEASRRPEFTAYLANVAEGSAYPAVRADRFLEAPVPDLPADQIHMFEAQAAPLRKLVASQARESRTLAATRDALLPQLMSGKLRVRDAEALIVQAGV